MKWWQSVLIGLLCLVIALYPVFDLGGEEIEESEKIILRLWNVDTFEGGVGSRASFLGKAANRFEKKYSLYIMVTPHTKESAERALRSGDIPDMLSCGPGLEGVAELAAEVDGEYGAAWCIGKYCLYSFEDDFDDVSAENTVVSQYGNSLSAVAARLAGIRGTLQVESSLTAYVNFLNGKYRYLLGTQRDLHRFQSKGVAVCVAPLPGFSDLFQYVSVLCAGTEAEYCRLFVRYLLSEEVQKSLSEIGMYSSVCSVYDEGAERELEKCRVNKTIPLFVSESAILELREKALSGVENKILENFLKRVDS